MERKEPDWAMLPQLHLCKFWLISLLFCRSWTSVCLPACHGTARGRYFTIQSYVPLGAHPHRVTYLLYMERSGYLPWQIYTQSCTSPGISPPVVVCRACSVRRPAGIICSYCSCSSLPPLVIVKTSIDTFIVFGVIVVIAIVVVYRHRHGSVWPS